MRKPLAGKDLATCFPDIAKEWDENGNDGYKPSDFSIGSHFIADWICPNGHSYQCPIKDRIAKHRGCPLCRKRLKTSFPEQALFFYVKKAFPDAINGDRKTLGGRKELDVFVPSLMMAVEYDGLPWHRDEKLAQERAKYALCKEKGIRLIRIKENEAHWDTALGISDYIVRCPGYQKNHRILSLAIKTVLEILGDSDFAEIFSVKKFFEIPPVPKFFDIAAKNDEPFPRPPEIGSLFPKNDFSQLFGPKVKSDVNVDRDELEILGNYYNELEHHSLADKYPQVAKEWHPTKNGKLTPKMFSPATSKKVWWLCPQGHSYRAAISERTKRNDGCPYCYGRYAITGENDFATLHPELLEEWDWEANDKIGLNPKKLKPMSDAVAHWICSKCGRKWTAPIKTRSKGHGCWVCANPLRNKKSSKTVYVYDKEMNLVAEYSSVAEAAKETGVARANICRACKHNYHPIQNGLFFTYLKRQK